MNGHPEKINIMILDACRSNPGFSRDIVGSGLAEVRAGSGTIIALQRHPIKVLVAQPMKREMAFIRNVYCNTLHLRILK